MVFLSTLETMIFIKSSNQFRSKFGCQFKMTHNVKCICDGRAFAARHADAEAEFLFVAEVKYKCSIA